MNALVARDAVFSELHRTVLKPLGFRKQGHWSVLDESPSYRTVYLRASRWSSKTEATFWIDVQVFRSDWFSLLWGPKAFPGPTEGTPSLVSQELNTMISPHPTNSLVINATTDVSEMTKSLCNAMKNRAWPILQECSSFDGILSHYKSQDLDNGWELSAAAICVLLGRQNEAKQYIQLAKERAPHDNALKFIELREKAMWANSLAL